MNIAITMLGLAARFARRRIERAREEAIAKALADLASRPRPATTTSPEMDASPSTNASKPERS